MSKEDSLKIYSETCNMVRHYSNISFGIRTLALAQGLIFVGIWSVNYPKSDFELLFLIPSFGLLLTILVFSFHKGYFDAIGMFTKKAAMIEMRLFSKLARPFFDLQTEQNKRYKKWFVSLVTVYATFTFIAVLFVAMLILTWLKYKGHIDIVQYEDAV